MFTEGSTLSFIAAAMPTPKSTRKSLKNIESIKEKMSMNNKGTGLYQKSLEALKNLGLEGRLTGTASSKELTHVLRINPRDDRKHQGPYDSPDIPNPFQGDGKSD